MSWKGIPIEGVVWVASRLGKPRHSVALKAEPDQIFIFRPSDLGDLLTTTPLFQALRTRFPKTRIVAAVGSWGRQIVEGNPNVDEIVELDAPWNNKVLKQQSWPDIFRFIFRSDQVQQLRVRKGFDVGIDILGSHLGSLLMMRLGVRYRIGVRGYRGGWTACDKYIHFRRDVHVARAALAQAELLGATELPEARPQIFLDDSERERARQAWSKAADPRAKKLLVACGGGFEGKCWPPELFADLLAKLAHDPEPGAPAPNVLLVGGPSDCERAKRIATENSPGVRSLCGQSSLRETFALAEQADVVLSNASMMLHVAAAFHRPTIAILGGIHTDLPEHDRLWGYPPPYESVGPDGGERWPSVHKVEAALRSKLWEGDRVPNSLEALLPGRAKV